MTLTSVVCWKWAKPGYRSTFGPEQVHRLRDQVRRHYPHAHRFICVTDDPKGLDSGVEVLPLWTEFAHLQNPHGPTNPNCYRRLRLFHPDAAQWFGERFVSLDLDTVIVGDLTPLWDRSEEIVLWGDTNPTTFYNGSMVLLAAGARPRVWTEFDPHSSPARAKASGQFGSDQGWIGFCLGRGEARWSTEDGVYSFRNHIQPKHGTLPANARIVFFHGKYDPWTPTVQAQCPWVRAAYTGESEAVAS